jgi:diketogulonate reductase-like aldo/keto reductase
VSGNKGPSVQPPLEETWRDMEKLVDAGLVRAIGVSNFSIKKLRALQPHAHKPISALQVEAHPYWRNDALAGFCAEHNIHFSAYSGLGSRHSAGHPAAHEEKEELVDDARVKDIATRAGKSVHQVLLRWALQRRPDTSVIFKSSTPEHIKARAARKLRGCV